MAKKRNSPASPHARKVGPRADLPGDKGNDPLRQRGWLLSRLRLQACTEEDAREVEESCSLLEADGVPASNLQELREVLAAFWKVQSARAAEVNSKADLEALEATVREAETAGLQPGDVKRKLVVLQALKTASDRPHEQCPDGRALAELCAEASRLKIKSVFLDQALLWAPLLTLSQQEVENEEDLQALQEACKTASAMLLKAELRLQRASALSAALRKEIESEEGIPALREACTEARQLRLHTALLELAEPRLQRALAREEALRDRAIASESELEALSLACSEARSTWASSPLLAQAERRLEKAQALRVALLQGREQAVSEAQELGWLLDLVKAARQRIEERGPPQLRKQLPHHFPVLEKLLKYVGNSPEEGQGLLELIEAQHCRIYSLTRANYGKRGGYDYFKPCGWLRFGVRMEEAHEDWCRGYHGTKSHNLMSILKSGLKRPAGKACIAHGQVNSPTKRSIYLSPSVEVAGHPVYGQLVKLGEGHWAQVVIQCCVKPGSFAVRDSTLRDWHWPTGVPFDTYYPTTKGLEWLVEDEDALVVSAFLVREFGAQASADLYGALVQEVTEGNKGPEYEWTRLRAEELRGRGAVR